MTREDINLEDLIQQTEDKITNNEYFEDVTVVYDTETKQYNVHLRIKPISQARFAALSKNKQALDNAEFNTLIIHECVLNKHDNKPFTLKQINELFSGGLAAEIAVKCCKVSGINLKPEELMKLQNF